MKLIGAVPANNYQDALYTVGLMIQLYKINHSLKFKSLELVKDKYINNLYLYEVEMTA